MRIPWYHQSSTSTSNPFVSLGSDWCPCCKQETECDTAAEHCGTTFTYKRWCLKCGKVIKAGIMDNVKIMSNRCLPRAALEWTFTPGKDRS